MPCPGVWCRTVLVAKELEMPLDLVTPRKIGHPGNPEYAICAITEAGELFCNESVREYLDQDWLQRRVIRGGVIAGCYVQ